MASERQRAANRRNALKSTGPRTATGKRRASGNAYRHGFAGRQTTDRIRAAQVEKLARQIVGNTVDVTLLEDARAVAYLQFRIADIRAHMVTLVNRIIVFGQFAPPRPDLKFINRFLDEITAGKIPMPRLVDGATTMPTTEPERTAEAIRRTLPEIKRLTRYEIRTTTLRDRLMRSIIARKQNRA